MLPDTETSTLDWPLMRNNIRREDLDAVVEYLSSEEPFLTQGDQVRTFEREWSDWLGMTHSVFVNSGSSANLLTIAALRELRGPGEVIVPSLTWVSDITAVLRCGLTPVFVDIDPLTLGMDNAAVLDKISSQTRAVFLTHVLGYNALTQELLDALRAENIPLIEDTCESYGATFDGRKLGTLGWASNFSFYYAHHMSTIEGGMISTDDAELYEMLRMLRSHGMVREATCDKLRQSYADAHPDLNPKFIFAIPGFNVRSTEINAVIGRHQLRRLDSQNDARRGNLQLFLQNLDPQRFVTEFRTEGSCNYALTLVLREADDRLCQGVMQALDEQHVEFRRGTAGGGNQLRQPYLKNWLPGIDPSEYPHVDHVHFYGFYIGNYPDLEQDKIVALCNILNSVASS